MTDADLEAALDDLNNDDGDITELLSMFYFLFFIIDFFFLPFLRINEWT